MVVVGGISSPALSSKPSHKGLPALTASRCQTLQHFILNSSTVDGIVCISGIDSRYSPEAKTFTNFLLFGCSNYKGGSHSRYQNVDTDELIIVIKAHSIHVYGVPSVINAIMPQLSRLENLELLCLNDVENIDEDIVEDHKIHSFINMTRDLTKIAMPYSNAAPFNPMSVEKWPIIQAYALEDYGGNGFFTMGRDMSAFCPDALGLFQNFDLGSIRNLLSDSCLQIQYHWSTLIKNIQLSVQRDFTIDLESAIEPLVSYTTHGHVDAPKPLINLCSHPVTQKPLYVTCSVREPMGSVSCGRTYFICDKTNSPDLIVLSCLYEAAVTSAHKSIQHFMTSLNPSKLQSYFTKKFLDKLESYKYSELTKYPFKQLKVDVALTAFDVKGKLVNLTKREYLPIMKCLTVKIKNIQSLEKKDFVYKDIVFEETFIDSSLSLTNEDSVSQDNDHIVVTDAIPTFVQWNQHQTAEGDPLQIPCSLFSQYPDVYDSDCIITDNSLRIVSQYAAPLSLDFSTIKEVKLLKHSSTAILLYIDHSQVCLPPFSKRLCLVFWQRGNGFKSATDTLIPKLRDAEVKIEQEGIPEDLVNKFTNLVGSKSDGTASHSDELKTISSQFPTYSSFESHFILSNAGKSIVYKPQDLDPLSNPIEPLILITILIGIPGGNQEKISSLITKFSKDDKRFIILRQPFGSEEMYSGENLSKSLTMLVDRATKQPPKDVTRVMIIVSAYIEISEVITTITNHPKQNLADKCKISCVNTCIDMRNLFISNKTFFPKVLEHCRDGWTNNIIVSGAKKGSSEDFRLLRLINQTANIIEVVGNQLISAENIAAICSEDAFNQADAAFDRLVSCPGWFSGKFKPNPPYLEVEQMSLSFAAPLCKARFMAQLKSLHTKEGKVFVDRIVMKGSMFYLKGRTSFTDDGNLYEVECTPRSGSISIEIVPNKSVMSPSPPSRKAAKPFCFIFTGHQLALEHLKAWLQSCVPKPPTKKPLLTKNTICESDISKLKDQVQKDSLPEGWFYNGSQYCSMMAGKTFEHPLLAEVVEKYLTEKNTEIENYNIEVDSYKMPVLFEGM